MSTADDVHRLARRMPHVTVLTGPKGNTIYQVGGRSFVFFRTPQPDAPFDDVIMFWVGSEEDRLALLAAGPFFTTSRFDGHPSVLVRASRLGEVALDELTEIVQDAWLARASARRRERWLAGRRD